MASWHAVRVRADLYRVVSGRAVQERRSVASMVDVLLSWALEQMPNTSASNGGGPPSGVIPGESGRGALGDPPGEPEADARSFPGVKHASASVRAPEGQVTVEEALTRCPVCNDHLDDDRVCVDPDCTSHRSKP